MFRQRPYLMAEAEDDPLTIPVPPEPMMRLDPGYSGGDEGKDGGGVRQRPCWPCLLVVWLAVGVVVTAFFRIIVRFNQIW